MVTNLNTSEKILQCARSLIVAGGYNAFSYADIAKVVGIRNASIHHHFPSKASLVQALVVSYREEAEAGIAELERNVSDPVEQLMAYTNYWEACITDETASFCVCALLATEIPTLPEEVAQEVKLHFQTFSKWLTSVLERGEQQGKLVLVAPAKTEAEILLASVHGAMLSARAYGDPNMFSVIIKPLIARLLQN
jgi:TetR/AcrR family transcriptional regulator, transcriptional repressor for nem operon